MERTDAKPRIKPLTPPYEPETAELLNHRELIVEGEGVREDDDVRTEIRRSAAQRQNFFVVSFTDNANG